MKRIKVPNSLDVRIGDCRGLIREILPESVSLVITDPPYASDYNWAFEWLYSESSRVLKNNGSLVFLLGHTQLNFALVADYCELRYWWIGALLNNQSNRLHGKDVMIKFKPWLWFLKGKKIRSKGKVPFDVVGAKASEWQDSKLKYKFAQPDVFSKNLIPYLTSEGDVVLDPFCGSGTFVESAESLGRKGIGFDIKEI